VGLDSNQSHAKGELPFEGIRMLRFALLGQLISFTILAVTTFLTLALFPHPLNLLRLRKLE